MTDFIWVWCNHLLVALEIIMLMFFAAIFFQKRLKGICFWISISILISGNIVTLIFLDRIFWLKVFILIILDALCLKCAYIDTTIQSVGIAIGFYSFVNVCDAIVLLLLSTISKRSVASYMENPIEYYLICYWMKCMELLFVVIIGLLAKKRFHFRNTQWQDWLRAMLFPLTTALCSIIFFHIYESEPSVGLGLLFCEFVLLLFDVIAIWMLDYLDRQQIAIQDNIILRRSIKQEKESIEALVEAYSEQRKKTHDFQNQLSIIYGLALQESPNGEVARYVKRLLKEDLFPILIAKTGRNVVDILLTQKNTIAKKNEIDFQFQLDDLSGFPLSDEDLIVILSNLIDNALNACKEIADSKNRTILLKMRTTEVAGFLYLENSTARDIKIRDNHVISRELNSLEHGYGLKNVMAILDCVDALYTFDYNKEGHVFSFSAQFSLAS